MPKGTVRFPFLVFRKGKVFAKPIKTWYNDKGCAVTAVKRIERGKL